MKTIEFLDYFDYFIKRQFTTAVCLDPRRLKIKERSISPDTEFTNSQVMQKEISPSSQLLQTRCVYCVELAGHDFWEVTLLLSFSEVFFFFK